MKVAFHQVGVSTRGRTDLIDITDDVEGFVEGSGVKDGICLISSLHSTTAIAVNEHESGLMKDLLHYIDKEFPMKGEWLHNRVDDNAAAHLASTFLGAAKGFPVQKGKLVRGTWQNIFLVELDGPRSRTVIIEVIGE